MGTYPPPFSPGDARREARDLRRAHKAQYRMQTALLRRRPSFVGPLLLITVGVLALLLETGRLEAAAFWPWYARWWPLLLILIGLGLLFEYFLDRKDPAGGRRSLGGIVWLVILLSLAGVASRTALHFGDWSDGLGDAFGDHGSWLSMLGEQHVQTRTLVRQVTPNISLTIENARGNVQVSVADAPEIRVEAQQVVHAGSDEEARKAFEAIMPSLRGSPGETVLQAPGRDGASVDLKVTAPAGTALVVRTTHGEVTLSGLRRNLDVNVSHGDVTIDDLGGSAHLQMDHGDVHARNIAGDLSIDGRADDVTISGVRGKSILNGDFFGDTRLANIGSLVHFHSSRTDLDLRGLGGEMTLDSGDLRLVNPSGGLRLVTRAKDVEVTGLVGDAHIEDNNGDLNVTTGLPLGNLQLIDHTGSLVLTVPANASFSVHGRANQGDEVTTDFGLATDPTGDHKTVSGQVGTGGPHLELETDHGDLTLHRGGTEQAASPEPPAALAPPVPPVPPDAPMRHLHLKGVEPQPTVQ